MDLLAGDIGGTNTRLAIYRTEGDCVFTPLAEKTFSSKDYNSLEDILELFTADLKLRIQRACFGVAGPVIRQASDTTNLPWKLSAKALNHRFGFEQTWLLNDLEANAWGIGALTEHDLHTLHPGVPQAVGNASIISAGTGLGEAGLFWDGQTHRPFSSEGGHSDFSPTNKLEYALYESLAAQYGHVSWERLISGPGLVTIHSFLCRYRSALVPDWLLREMQRIGPAKAISNMALQQRDPICEEALTLFVHLYGREAGNHALKIMANGGVYLGGGIAPQILQRLQAGDFLEAFFAKGRMRHLTEAMPVKVILNDKAALLGAARFARLQ